MTVHERNDSMLTATVGRGAARGGRHWLAGLILSVGLSAAPAAVAAQTRFEWPDTAVDVAHYATVEECQAAISRVRITARRRERRLVWPDTLPWSSREALEPDPTSVIAMAKRCATRFPEPTAPLAYFTELLELYLVAGHDADAAAITTRELAAIGASPQPERLAIVDRAAQIYADAHPVRSKVAEALLRQNLPLRDRVGRLASFLKIEQAAKHANDSISWRKAAASISALADSLTPAERASKTFRAIDSQLMQFGVEFGAGDQKELDSLRRSTSAYVTLRKHRFEKATGLSFPAARLPIGTPAAPVVGDFWFPAEAANSPRPSRGRVGLVVLINQQCLTTNGDRESANCWDGFTTLRRIARRFPTLEITVAAQTRGHFMYVEPPPPAQEADLIRQWLDAHGIPGVLAVSTTPFRRLPEPDRRRIDWNVVNTTHYAWASPGGFLVDPDGNVVEIVQVLRSNESRLSKLIDVLLHRSGEAD